MSQRKPQRAKSKIPAPARASPGELAERHVSLVIHVARDFLRRLPSGVNFGDLVGAGNLGLVEAARRFDPANGASFSTFARHRIRGAITDSLRRLDPVSRRLRSFQRAATQAADTLRVTLGRTPGDAEVAARIGLPACRFEKLSRELGTAGSAADSSPRVESNVLSVDRLPALCADPERLAQWAELRETMKSALLTLPYRERTVIHWRHFDGWSMKRIAARLGVTESRVSQIHAGAIRRLGEHPGFRKGF